MALISIGLVKGRPGQTQVLKPYITLYYSLSSISNSADKTNNIIFNLLLQKY